MANAYQVSLTPNQISMIELIPEIPDNVVALRKSGESNPADYDDVFLPAVEQAQQKHKKIRLLYQFETEFSADSKVGLKELAMFEQIALVTDSEATQSRIKKFGFFLPCKIKVFSFAEVADAKAWIVE